MAVFNPDPEATEPKTFTMPFGGVTPPVINVNPPKKEG